MERRRFELAYDGSALRDGTMDLRDLAPALLAVGDVCRRANELLNGPEVDVSCRARAGFENGSFEILLELWQETPEEVQQALVEHVVANANELLALIGFAFTQDGPASQYSVIEFLKWLGGKLPRLVTPKELPGSAERESGDLVVENYNGDTVTINRNTYNIAGDVIIQKNLAAVVEPLEQPGIDTFESREGSRVVVSVSKEEAGYLEGPETPEESLPDTTSRAFLQIVRPSFEGDLLWWFFGGGQKVTARMGDEVFMERVRSGREYFKAGDVLDVEIVTRSRMTSRGFQSENEITKVRGLKHQPSQSRLPGT